MVQMRENTARETTNQSDFRSGDLRPHIFYGQKIIFCTDLQLSQKSVILNLFNSEEDITGSFYHEFHRPTIFLRL